jgi:tetratricopeptide (TPR) repeat protein
MPTTITLEDESMGLLNWLGMSGLFAKLTLDEKRRALDLDDDYWQSILDARKGKTKVVEVGTDTGFVSKLSDGDIRQAIEVVRLQKKATAASAAGNHKEAIKRFEAIVAKAPFDSISMMSLGVQYAYLRDGGKAVQCLKRALQSDPDNQRIRGNLEGVRREFGL